MTVVSNGTNLINNGTLDSAVPSGKMTLIKTLTASSSATLSFVHGASSVVFDNTYDSYVFKFYNIHPASDNKNFSFNLSSDSGSNYNVTKTTTVFTAQHGENGSNANIEYSSSLDLAQSTAFQKLSKDLGNGSDESLNGTLNLFNPSSNTFVKHFISRTSSYFGYNRAVDMNIAGYGNTTSAINAVQFKMSSGNFDGIIKLYGVG